MDDPFGYPQGVDIPLPLLLAACMTTHAGQYFLMVRQSVDGSSHVSKPHLLASVVAVASAAARLHQRSTVLEFPDAALAVVLMEHTLANKVMSVCGLQPRLCTNGTLYLLACLVVCTYSASNVYILVHSQRYCTAVASSCVSFLSGCHIHED